jgi:tRNA threonylcarbamoyladenosine biosynthesis protein TsaE
METFDLLLPDEAATALWGGALAGALAAEPLAEQSFVVHLRGDLGTGKTAMARAILRGLGFAGAVKSPTFTLLETYNLTKFMVYHFDLYRFSSSGEWFDSGFDDIMAAPGLVLLEWPEKAAGVLADPDLLLELTAAADDDARLLHARAFSGGGRRCLTRSRPAVTTRATGAASPPGAAC